MSRIRTSVNATALTFVLFVPLPAQAPTTPAVQRLVRTYVDALNGGDASALAGLYSREVGVVAIEDGKITRGWDAIRADADSLVSGGDQFTLGSVDVTPLGQSYALAIANLTVSFRTERGEEKVRAALSLVLKKNVNQWLLVHGHTSTMPLEDAEGADVPAPAGVPGALYVESMKSDLRNLVIAEEAFFADSLRYTNRVGRGGVTFSVSAGNTVPTIRVTADGWVASIGNANTKTRCVIFVGSTRIPPATKEGQPACS